MNRFTRFSRISPLELYLESERLAWCCALPLMVLFCLLAVGALLVPAPGRLVAEGGQACFVGVVVEEADALAEQEPPEALPLPPLPTVELLPELACRAEVLPPPDVAELPWEAPELEPTEPLLVYEMPESSGKPLRRAVAQAPTERGRVAASRAASGKSGAEGELVAARYRSTPHPPYPPGLLNRRVQGRVGLRIAVDAEGLPSEVTVSSPSGYAAFDRCAREWVLAHWRFHPAQRGGVAVASIVRTHVDFVLR